MGSRRVGARRVGEREAQFFLTGERMKEVSPREKLPLPAPHRNRAPDRTFHNAAPSTPGAKPPTSDRANEGAAVQANMQLHLKSHAASQGSSGRLHRHRRAKVKVEGGVRRSTQGLGVKLCEPALEKGNEQRFAVVLVLVLQWFVHVHCLNID